MSKLEPVIKYLETIKDTVLNSTDYDTLVNNIVSEHDAQMTLLKSHPTLMCSLKICEAEKYKIHDSWNEHINCLSNALKIEEINEILENAHSKEGLIKKFDLLKMYYNTQETNILHVQTEPLFKPYNTIDIVLTMNVLTNIITHECSDVRLQSVCVIIMYDELLKNFNFVLDNMDYCKILCTKLKMFIEDEEIVEYFDELSTKYGLEQKFYVKWNEIFETLEFNTE